MLILTLVLTMFSLGCGLSPGEQTAIGTMTAMTPSVSLTSVSPTSSPTAGGGTLTINGSLLKTGLSVMVGTNSCTSVTFVSSSQATCIIPARAAGTVSITVTNTDGQTATLAGALVYADTAAAPTVSSVSPVSGSTNGTTFVTITGTGFQTGATASFGGTACTTLTVVSASQITCSTPAKALGAVNVVIQNPDVQSGTLTSGYTYMAPPTYSSLKTSFSTARCSGCHGTQAGFSTEIHSQISTVLVAGSPSTSKLYIRVANNTMPGGTPLTDAQKIAVYEWILDGAPNN